MHRYCSSALKKRPSRGIACRRWTSSSGNSNHQTGRDSARTAAGVAGAAGEPDPHHRRRGMEELKKTNPLLYRMAPPRGGTAPPDAKFLAVFAVVGTAGLYAWFIDPPSKKEREE